jgi:hypothetical protein
MPDGFLKGRGVLVVAGVMAAGMFKVLVHGPGGSR